jgi:Tfp pilus assembly protein PilF
MRPGIAVARIAALLLLAGGTGYALDRWCLEPLRCARAASAGAAALDRVANRIENIKRRVAGDALASLGRCECISPSRARILATRGALFETAGDHRSAIADYRRALATERRPEIYLQLGLAQLGALDRAGAVDSLARACAFDPSRLPDIPYEEIRREVERRMRPR